MVERMWVNLVYPAGPPPVLGDQIPAESMEWIPNWFSKFLGVYSHVLIEKIPFLFDWLFFIENPLVNHGKSP